MILSAYIDSSAFAKLLVREAETVHLYAALDSVNLYACDLLETEMRRIAVRLDYSQQSVTVLLQSVTLVEVDRADFRQAGYLAGTNLRSLDAIHLVSALRLELDSIFTYDVRMAEGARLLGMEVLAPGQKPEESSPS